MFGKFFIDCRINTADIRICFFYMQNGRIVIDFFTEAERFNFSVDTDSAAAQTKCFKIINRFMDSTLLTAQAFVFANTFFAPFITKSLALFVIIWSDRFVNIIRIFFFKRIVMIFFTMIFTPRQTSQFFTQINIIPIITIFNKFHLWKSFCQPLFAIVINTMDLKRLAFMIFFNFCKQFRQIFIFTAKRLQKEIHFVAVHI